MSKFHIIFGILIVAVCGILYAVLGGTSSGSSSAPASTEAAAPPPPSADDQAIKGFKIN